MYKLYLKTIFFLQNRPSQLKTCKTSHKNIPGGSTEFPNQNLRQIHQGVHELWSDTQTNRDYYVIYRLCMIWSDWTSKVLCALITLGKWKWNYQALIKASGGCLIGGAEGGEGLPYRRMRRRGEGFKHILQIIIKEIKRQICNCMRNTQKDLCTPLKV